MNMKNLIVIIIVFLAVVSCKEKGKESNEEAQKWTTLFNGNSFEDEKYKQPYETGPEIQVLDNEKHPDAKNGPIRQAGALYDMFSPTTEAVKAAGEWNQYLITVNHKANQNLQLGMVLEYTKREK